MYAQLVSIIAPVFVCAAIGFLWVRSGRPFEREFVTTLAINIATPALIFATLAKLQITPSAFIQMAGITFASLAGIAVICVAVLALLRWPARDYLTALLYGNNGNVGLPLCLFAFGDEGLSLGIAVFTVTTIAMFVSAPALAEGRLDWRLAARSPSYYAIAAGLVCMFTQTSPPEWLANTVNLLGGLAIPIMLLTLGASLAEMTVSSLQRSIVLAVMRLGIGLAVGLALAAAFGLTGTARGVLIIQSAMPSAVFVYLFAARHDRVPEEVASVVLVSTLLSFATLPLLLILALG